MIKVNLIPPEYLVRQKQRLQYMRIAGGASVIVVLFLGLSVMHIKSALSAEKLLVLKQAELKSYEAKVNKVKELEAVRAAASAHLEALNGLIVVRYYYPLLMADLIKNLAPTVWLTSITTTLKEDGKIDFTINANARSGDDIPAWLAQLENDRQFSNVSMGPLSVGGDKSFTFQLSASYAAQVK